MSAEEDGGKPFGIVELTDGIGAVLGNPWRTSRERSQAEEIARLKASFKELCGTMQAHVGSLTSLCSPTACPSGIFDNVLSRLDALEKQVAALMAMNHGGGK